MSCILATLFTPPNVTNSWFLEVDLDVRISEKGRNTADRWVQKNQEASKAVSFPKDPPGNPKRYWRWILAEGDEQFHCGYFCITFAHTIA
ncbi:hypothetical protein Hte_010364 [Hypoxylon texense]